MKLVYEILIKHAVNSSIKEFENENK